MIVDGETGLCILARQPICQLARWFFVVSLRENDHRRRDLERDRATVNGGARRRGARLALVR